MKNKGHSMHSIIQYLMVKRCVSASTLRQLLQRNSELSQTSVKEVISSINQRINPFKQKITIRKCEVTGSSYCVYLSTDSKADKKISKFSELEEEYLHLIIKNIMESHLGSMKTTDIIGLSSELSKPMAISTGETIVETFISEGYLIKDQSGLAYLSCLSLCELEEMIRGFDHQKCCLCRNFIVHGKSCTTCAAKAHGYCLKIMLSSNTSGPCPNCEEPWVAEQVEVSPLK